MIQIINIVVGISLLLIFLGGLFCNFIVKKKYSKMFSTMKNKGKDKHLLIIERDYRHGYLQERVERIKIFVEKEYYEIKISKIPLYLFEDFTISSVYFLALLGLTFTLIIIALPHIKIAEQMFEIFFLSVEGLVFGIILMITRTLLGIGELREIFKVHLCNYLEHELELYEEVEQDEEINTLIPKIKKANENNKKDRENIKTNTEYYDNNVDNLSVNTENQSEDVEITFDERVLLQVLEEILG